MRLPAHRKLYGQGRLMKKTLAALICLLPLSALPASAQTVDSTVNRTETAVERHLRETRAAAEAASAQTEASEQKVVTGEIPLTEPSLQSDITRQIRKNPNEKFITFNSENDMYGGGTDRNYTNGARVTYFDLGAPVPEFFHVID